MSADDEPGTTWKVRLHCTRAEAEAIPWAENVFADLDAPPTLLTDEPDPAQPEAWTLDAYFVVAPSAELVGRLYQLAPSAPIDSAIIERLGAQDWVTLSQAGLEPVRAGRFVVHTAAHAAARRPGDIGIAIEAGLAFGTGQHFTTHGCLQALADLARQHAPTGPRRFANALDLGTGSGILALAVAKTWRTARVTASDIDTVAVDVARGNVRGNRVRLGSHPGAIAALTATGMNSLQLRRRAPYDLITANILAAPLIALARPVVAALAQGGTLILAGLLTTQARRVAAAYTARGCRLVTTYPRGEWPTLVLRRSR